MIAGVPAPAPPTPSSGQLEFRVASFADLSARTLHDLLRLRVDVFVVEQACAYPEIDGRDVEPDTRHLWFARDGVPVAYLRLLTEPDPTGKPGDVVIWDNRCLLHRAMPWDMNEPRVMWHSRIAGDPVSEAALN